MNGGKKKALIFDFSLQKSCSFLLRTQIQLFTPGAKSKSGFLFSDFDFSLQEIWFFQLFYSKNSKSQVKIAFSSFSEPKFRFFTPTNLIFPSQNPKSKSDFSSQISTIHSKKSVFFSFYSKKSKSQVKTGFFFFSESKFRFFHSISPVLFFSDPKFNFSLQ